MEKNITFYLAIIVFIFIPISFIAPQPAINLNVDESSMSADIGSILIVNGISGAPSLFCVDIIPLVPGDLVTLDCTLNWQPPESNGYQFFASFTTKPIAAKTICNQQIGSGEVLLDKSNTNQALIEETRQRGKLTGKYSLSVRGTERGISSQWVVKILDFTNQTQTLTINQPNAGLEYDEGNVIAEWDAVPGAQYEIKANLRTASSQSLEDALNQGTPFINNINVGSVTSVNLHSLLQREWQPGEEIVFQVTAVTGSNQKLYSNIINFRIRNNNPSINTALINGLSQLASLLGKPEMASGLQKGNIKILEITTDDGTIINFNDLSEIIDSFIADPTLVVKLEYNKN